MKRLMLEILNAVKKKVLKTQRGVDCGLVIPLLFSSRLQDENDVKTYFVILDTSMLL
jgi:hypothetical protein